MSNQSDTSWFQGHCPEATLPGPRHSSAVLLQVYMSSNSSSSHVKMKLSLKVDCEMSVTKWRLYNTASFPFSLSSQKHIALSSPHPWPWKQLWHHIVLEGHLPWEVSALGSIYFCLEDMIWALRMDRDWICVAEKRASGAQHMSLTPELGITVPYTFCQSYHLSYMLLLKVSRDEDLSRKSKHI